MHIIEYLIRKLESKEKKIIKINKIDKENNTIKKYIILIKLNYHPLKKKLKILQINQIN